MVSDQRVAAEVAERFVEVLNLDRGNPAQGLMRAKAADLVNATDHVMRHSLKSMLGASAVDPPAVTTICRWSRSRRCARAGAQGSADRGNQCRGGPVVHPVPETAAHHRARHRTGALPHPGGGPGTGSSPPTRTTRTPRPVSSAAT